MRRSSSVRGRGCEVEMSSVGEVESEVDGSIDQGTEEQGRAGTRGGRPGYHSSQRVCCALTE